MAPTGSSSLTAVSNETPADPAATFARELIGRGVVEAAYRVADMKLDAEDVHALLAHLPRRNDDWQEFFGLVMRGVTLADTDLQLAAAKWAGYLQDRYVDMVEQVNKPDLSCLLCPTQEAYTLRMEKLLKLLGETPTPFTQATVTQLVSRCPLIDVPLMRELLKRGFDLAAEAPHLKRD